MKLVELQKSWACKKTTGTAFYFFWKIIQDRTRKVKNMGDSTLRTLHSDTKINILNPNLDDKMFNKGVQTYLESNFNVPFVPNKKML